MSYVVYRYNEFSPTNLEFSLFGSLDKKNCNLKVVREPEYIVQDISKFSIGYVTILYIWFNSYRSLCKTKIW